MTKIPLETQKNDQNTPKPKKWPKYSRNPKNEQNSLETPRNYQNTPKTQKITNIPPKPKNDQNTLEIKNDQNTHET